MAQGQPKPPPTASNKTRHILEGKLSEPTAKMGHFPNSGEWDKEKPYNPRGRTPGSH